MLLSIRIFLFLFILHCISAYAIAGSEKEHPATNIAGVLCSHIYTNDDITNNSEETLYVMVGNILKPKVPSKVDVLGYLNEHSQKMICDEGLHYLKFAVMENVQFDFIIGVFNSEKRFYTKELQLDFNTITLTMNPATGKEEPMTLLDYINKVALPTFEGTTDSTEKKLARKLKAFREIITNTLTKRLNKPHRFIKDAKTFEELKEEMTPAELSRWGEW